MKNGVEFYLETSQYAFCTVDAEFQPSKGDLVNIEGITFEVLGRSFTVDHAGTPRQSMRCNVIVKKRKAR